MKGCALADEKLDQIGIISQIRGKQDWCHQG
jgi:hypothetical protein